VAAAAAGMLACHLGAGFYPGHQRLPVPDGAVFQQRRHSDAGSADGGVCRHVHSQLLSVLEFNGLRKPPPDGAHPEGFCVWKGVFRQMGYTLFF